MLGGIREVRGDLRLKQRYNSISLLAFVTFAWPMSRGMLTRKSTLEIGVFLCCGAPENDKRVRKIKIAGKKKGKQRA